METSSVSYQIFTRIDTVKTGLARCFPHAVFILLFRSHSEGQIKERQSRLTGNFVGRNA